MMCCERKYLECFCRATERQDFIRYRDALMPDMYYHNFTFLKNIKEDTFITFIESELDYSKSEAKDFCLLRCHTPVNPSMLTALSCTPEVSVAGYYVLDLSNEIKSNPVVHSCVHKIDKPEMLEDLLCLDLQHDEQSMGREFCTRRVYSRKDVYLSEQGVDCYICYSNGRAVGSGDLFAYGNTAKIEDFSIVPQEQRKGYGTALLKTLIDVEQSKNATAVYVETDEGDTAKQMYQKCGFHKIYECTDLLFTL